MRGWLALSAVLAALLLGAAAPDAGSPAKPRAADAGAAKAASEDEQLIKDLELLENLDVLRRLDQVDVED
ncbi:MAG TPA: hypothetical protein VGK67_17915 [Myxococcales bacterium]